MIEWTRNIKNIERLKVIRIRKATNVELILP